MKSLIVILVLICAASPSYAGTSGVVLAFGYTPSAPTARMQVPADFVAMPLHIHSDAKDPVKRADDIEKAVRALTDKLQQQPDVAIKSGVVSLSPREQSALKAFSSYESSGGSSAQLYVLGALKSDANVFAMTKRLYQAVNGIPLADGTKLTLGNTTLGLHDPERYRADILKLIAKSIEDTKKTTGFSGSVDIDGLENSVSVMQLNESEVALFINYRLKMQTKAP